jgi:hypothetical protein
MLLAQTGDASRGPSDETTWVSHPSAIGYRRAGVYAAISSGSHVTIAEVAPGFDSGMNDGTSGEELTRISNFYTGAEENPTAAQSAPTPRAEQQVSAAGLGGVGRPGGGMATDGTVGPTSNNEPTWRAGVNPLAGHGFYNPFAGWGWPGWANFGDTGRAPYILGTPQDALDRGDPSQSTVSRSTAHIILQPGTNWDNEIHKHRFWQ